MQNLANLLGKDDDSARKLLHVLDLPTLESNERAEWNWYASILLYHTDITKAKLSYLEAWRTLEDDSKFRNNCDNYEYFAYKLPSSGKVLLSSHDYELNMSVLNPSIIKHGNGYLIALRTTNFVRTGTNYGTRDGSPIVTKYLICEYDSKLNYVSSKPLETDLNSLTTKDMRVQGVEDIRLGKDGDKIWFTGTTYQFGTPTRMLLGSMSEVGTSWKAKLTLPNQIEPNRSQKNWLPIIGTDMFIYGWNPLSVYSRNGDLKFTVKSNLSAVKLASGSTCAINWLDGYICVVHYVSVKKDERRYTSSFMYFTENVVKVSRPFILEYAHGIEYISGLAEDNEHILLSYGIDDKYAVVSRVPKSLILSLFA